MSKEFFWSGVDGFSGRYSPGPGSDSELAELVIGHPPFAPGELRERRWWVERYSVARREPAFLVDPFRPDKAGWGVIFSGERAPAIREALAPLLLRRRQQAGDLYKELAYRTGESKLDFLGRHKASPGMVDPGHLPYFLLLVGEPEAIPFQFQHELDLQYAVGRLWFERLEDFACYAESVVRAETYPPSRPKRLVFFAPENPDDRATESLSRDWVAPLAGRLSQAAGPDWEVCARLGPDATKQQLARLLGGDETPSLLFLASHGLCYPDGHERQLSFQGALLCQDWPGPIGWARQIPPEFSFAADDVPRDADLHGLIAFLFADFGGGTAGIPSELSLEMPAYSVPRPSMARLPQQLLSHPQGGALAVVSLVDRSWGMSFGGTGEGRIQVAASVLRRLLEGCPLGFAMESINQRSAELAVELSSLWDGSNFQREVGRERFASLWRATQDTRSLMVFGDPAVHLSVPLVPKPRRVLRGGY